MKKCEWIQWHSMRHQDGRRSSAIGHNTSLSHVRGEGYNTLCGIGVGAGDHEEYDNSRRCQKCLKILGNRDNIGVSEKEPLKEEEI